jgi:nucleoside-diphosphate-sugar epimerase
MAVLITGASGFIGSRLSSPGDRLFLRRAKGVVENEYVGDLNVPESISKACKNIETIYHCAGFAHEGTQLDSETHYQVNAIGTKNLLIAAANAGVKKFIFLSSVKAAGDPGDICVDEQWQVQPESAYGRSKRTAEKMVLEAGQQYDMHVVILRLAMVYGKGCKGNLMRMVNGVRAGWFPPVPENGNRRSIIHVEDVVDVVRQVANNTKARGKTYIVAHPEAPSTRQIYDEIRASLKLPAIRWSMHEKVFRAVGIVTERLGETTSLKLPVGTHAVKKLLGSECYSPTKINAELGWQASVGLSAGLKEMLTNEAPI